MDGMQTFGPAGGRPRAIRWDEAVDAFAASTGLDPKAVLQGDRFECLGQGFWLHYYDEEDPTGLTVLMDLGEIPEHSMEEVVRRMLAFNVSRTSLAGHYAILPDTHRGVQCRRIDLSRLGDAVSAAAVIDETIRTMVAPIFLAHLELLEGFGRLTGMSAEELMRSDSPAAAS
jgi:hypothetical protein